MPRTGTLPRCWGEFARAPVVRTAAFGSRSELSRLASGHCHRNDHDPGWLADHPSGHYHVVTEGLPVPGPEFVDVCFGGFASVDLVKT
jgi:hypothetical protein